MDKQYWNQYYAERSSPTEPSSFARHTATRLSHGTTILELGCGNGRDAFFFADQGHQVSACDQSAVIIQALNDGPKRGPQFFVDNIGDMQFRPEAAIAVVYTRFVLHALSNAEAGRAYAWIYAQLPAGGLFLSESRSVNDPLRGVGERLAEHLYMTDHKRRFLDRTELLHELEQVGFVIDEAIEENGLAVYKDDDPTVIRLVARKP